MLTEEQKNRINSLTDEEMAYEINLGCRSRFQREKFAYLQTCYQLRLSEENKKLTSEQSMANEKAKYKTNEVYNPLMIFTSKPIGRRDKRHETVLGKIAIGVIITIISFCIVWVFNHYLVP